MPCRLPAMTNGRCRMHGGASPGAPIGNTKAVPQFALRQRNASYGRRMTNASSAVVIMRLLRTAGVTGEIHQVKLARIGPRNILQLAETAALFRKWNRGILLFTLPQGLATLTWDRHSSSISLFLLFI